MAKCNECSHFNRERSLCRYCKYSIASPELDEECFSFMRRPEETEKHGCFTCSEYVKHRCNAYGGIWVSNPENVIVCMDYSKKIQEKCADTVPKDDPKLDPELQHILDNTPPSDWKYKISRESLAETLLIEFCKNLHLEQAKPSQFEDLLLNVPNLFCRMSVKLADGLIDELKKDLKP